jgi:flagellar protein FliO/FliZ
MFDYIVRLLIMVPLVGGMAFGALWLWKKYQPGMIGGSGERALKIVEALPMGTFGKLAIVEFDGQRLLIAITRGRIEKLAEGKAVPASLSGVAGGVGRVR